MKKLVSIALALIMVLAAVACQPAAPAAPAAAAPAAAAEAPAKAEATEAPAAEPAAKEDIVWILPQTLAADHPACVASQALADALSEATNGRWTLEVYTSGTLGTEMETVEMCRSNTVQLVPSNVTTMEVFLPDYGVFALPYLFRSWDDFKDYTDNSPLCQELWAKMKEASNLQFISIVPNGTRCLSTNGIPPITEPSQLKGVKIRSMEAPVWQNIISALGGTPIPVSFSELYMALQTGVVSGQDNPVALVYSQKFYEVLDNLYRTEHCFNTSSYYVNADAWAALDAEDQKLFNELWDKYMVEYYNSIFADYEKVAEDVVKDAGVRIWEQSELNMQAFYDSADEMIQREYMSNETYAKYINDIKTTYNYN